MKYLIKDNKIIKQGLPDIFERPNGELFYGGYEARTDLHYEDGWRDEIIPEYNNKLQYLGNLYYDIDNDICTYTIENKVIDLEEEKNKLLEELDMLKREFAIIAMQAKLTYDIEPQELTDLLSTIRSLNIIAKQEIEALTEENVMNYVLIGPQVNQLIDALNTFL